MKVFLSIKYHPDFHNQERITKIMDLLASHGMQASCIPWILQNQGFKNIDPQELMRLSLHEVRHSKLVIVDLTERGVGIGIEAGYAHSRGIPIITLSQGTEEVSESLAGISDHVFHYQNWEDVNKFLGEIGPRYLPK